MASVSGQAGTSESSHKSNLQAPTELKAELQTWSRERKLENLAQYSMCRASSGCKCSRFKAPVHSQPPELVGISEICHCGHRLNSHISHLESATDEDLNSLLGRIIDSKYLCKLLSNEEDSDTKNVYYTLSMALGKSVQQMRIPVVDDKLGNPPFEKPTISEAITNFVEYKFGHLSGVEREIMSDIARFFLKSLNYLKLRSITAKFQQCENKDEITDEIQVYRLNYKRWLNFCYVPGLCDSLPYYVPTDVFGLTLLKSVYDANEKQLVKRFEIGKDKMPESKRSMTLANLEKFLSMLREEVFNLNSPIWKSSYKEHVSSASHLDEDVPMEVLINIVKSVRVHGKIVGPENSSFSSVPTREAAENEEREGIIRFYIIGNSLDGKLSDRDAVWLAELEELIASNLVKMPSEYIVRFLFDPKHKSIVLIREGSLIGGICFLMFPSQGFAEIVFCVVKSHFHIKGYGAHMMNHLKDYCIKHNILHLLTYADVAASPFFQKQGFSHNIKLDEAKYREYMKDYTDATLMGCELNPLIVHTKFGCILRQQKEVITRLIEMKQTESHVYPGLPFFKNAVRQVPIEAIPGLKESEVEFYKKRHPQQEMDPDQLYLALENLLTQIKNHESAKPFLEPVDRVKYPDYFNYVKYPMDLKMMTERLKRCYYRSKHLFICDMQRIFNNCRNYKPGTENHIYANTLELFFKDKLAELL